MGKYYREACKQATKEIIKNWNSDKTENEFVLDAIDRKIMINDAQMKDISKTLEKLEGKSQSNIINYLRVKLNQRQYRKLQQYSESLYEARDMYYVYGVRKAENAKVVPTIEEENTINDKF